MPLYFMAIVESEAQYQESGAANFDEVMKAHNDFARELKKAGASIVSSEALQPTSTATYLRGPGPPRSASSTTRFRRRRRSSAATTSSRRPATPKHWSWRSGARRSTATSTAPGLGFRLTPQHVAEAAARARRGSHLAVRP